MPDYTDPSIVVLRLGVKMFHIWLVTNMSIVTVKGLVRSLQLVEVWPFSKDKKTLHFTRFCGVDLAYKLAE